MARGFQRRSLRRKPKPKLTWAEVEARHLFVEAARAQRCCAKCGKTGSDFEAHHVVERQYLRINGLPQFDAWNALRLCHDCHRKHTIRSERLPMALLTDENFRYAVHILGPDRADLQLHRWYEGTDPRLEKACRDAAAPADV